MKIVSQQSAKPSSKKKGLGRGLAEIEKESKPDKKKLDKLIPDKKPDKKK